MGEIEQKAMGHPPGASFNRSSRTKHNPLPCLLSCCRAEAAEAMDDNFQAGLLLAFHHPAFCLKPFNLLAGRPRRHNSC